MNKIRLAKIEDIKQMVFLSSIKRKAYEAANPLFWRSSSHADQEQEQYFLELLNDANHICLVSEIDHKLLGFIIGKLVDAPSVYDPGGLTLIIDDFCVADEGNWSSIGSELLATISQNAKSKNAIQIVIVSGVHDQAKNAFLKNQQLIPTSLWYTGKIS